MVGCSRISCTYRFFFRVNISNAVHPTINLIPIRELWHNQTRMNKMLFWIVPVYTGVYYSFLYLLFYFPIIFLIEKKRIIRILLFFSFGKIRPSLLSMTVFVSSATIWLNVEESRGNGRYYWKDSSLANRYFNWYSCYRFNRSFLLRFIFWIRFIFIVIGWTGF